MSLFGLFKPKGPEAARKLLQKANVQFNRNDFNLARITVEDALQHTDCPEDLKTELTRLHERCCEALTRYNLDMARSHMEAGELESALEFARTASTFARSESERHDTEAMERKIERQLDGGDFFTGDEARDNPLPEVDEDGYADLLLEGYPAFIREAVASDDALRRVMVRLNQEDMDGSADVLDLPPSPAVLYFQTVYHTLNGHPDLALPIFRDLMTTHESLMDPVRIAEFIDLVRLAEADDEVHELVARHPELEVIAAAARLAFARKDLDAALDLAETGMEMMTADNFDPAMVAFTGLLQFHQGNMEEAATLLESYRNMMASRGTLALPPQYALPLLTALEKTGRVDDALEIGLHTVRAFGCTDTLAQCHRLAARSTRDDLRKLVNRLPKPQDDPE